MHFLFFIENTAHIPLILHAIFEAQPLVYWIDGVFWVDE